MEATMEKAVSTMPKPKGRPKMSVRNDVPVKLDRGLVDKARVIATYRKVPLAEFLSRLLVGPVEKENAQMLREMNAKG